MFKFALFVSYFPQIIQGPISRYDELASQLYGEHDYEYGRVKFGVQRAIWGYFKKLVVAERISFLTSYVFENYQLENLRGAILFLSVLLYGIQVYADFSGGMDIVLGISEVFGITLTENFRQPFMAKSVAEFWQRWHMTLGFWMRDYIFYPLALSKPFAKFGKFLRKKIGNRAGKVIPTSLASFIVFVIVGIWHGAAWKYVFYGVFMAAFVSAGTLFADFYASMRKVCHINEEQRWWQLFQTVRTVFIITLGRYFSCAPTLTDALKMWGRTFSVFNPKVIVDGTFYGLGLSTRGLYLMLISVLIIFIVDVIHENGIRIRPALERQHAVVRVVVYIIAIFSILIFGVYGIGFEASNFIYQGF